MTNIEKFRMKRNRRLQSRGLPIFRLDAGSIHNNNTNNGGGGDDGGKEGGHGNTRLPYGIAKSMGLDTTGMSPSEVWAMLRGEGISPEEEYKKLEERGKGGGEEPAPEPAPEPPKPPKTDFTTEDGHTIDDLEISKSGLWGFSTKYSLSGMGADGSRHSPVYAESEDELLYALKEAGVTSVKIGDETVNPQEKDYPEVLFEIKGVSYGRKTISHVTGIDYADDGTVLLKGLDGNPVQSFYSGESIDFIRKQILEKSGGTMDIATSDLTPQKVRDYFKAKAEISSSYTDTYRGRTYTDLFIRPDGDSEYRLMGSTEGYDRASIKVFPTKDDLILFAKEKGISGFADPYAREIIKVADVETPKYVGVDSYGKHYSKITISKSKDVYAVKGTDLSGKTKKLFEMATYGACVETAKRRYGVEESDLTVSTKTKKTVAAEEAWKTSNKVEYYMSGSDEKVGALKGSSGSYGSFAVKGKTESGYLRTIDFGSEKAAMFWLKEKGVERFKYIDSEGEEKTAHPTKETFPEDAIYMRGELYTGMKVDYAGTSYGGKPLYKITGINPEGKEETIASTLYKIEDAYSYFPDWGKVSDHVTITEDAKNAEEVARKEKEEKERIERERREAEERARREEEERKAAFKARETEALTKDPEKYHRAGNGGHVYSDVKIVASDDRTKMVGTDIDGKSHTIDSSYGDRSSEFMSTALKLGFKDIKSEKSKRFTVEDAYGDTVTATDFRIRKRDSGSYSIEMSRGRGFYGLATEEEAEQKLKDMGVDSYYKSDGTVVGQPSREWGAPVDGMHDAIIKKGKDGKFTVTAHSDKAGGTTTVYTGSSADECKNWLESQNVDPFDVPVVTPNPNDDIVRIHSEVSLEHFDAHRVKQSSKSFISKMSESEKTECAEMLTELFKTQTYRMVRRTRHFADIVEKGFLSQIETGTGGMGAAVNREKRKDASKTYFGESKSTADHDYEKYGYLEHANDDDARGTFYGPVMFQFKRDNVKDRVTYTMGDSLNMVRSSGACAGYAGDAPTIEGISTASHGSVKGWLKEYKRYKAGEITAKELFSTVRRGLENNYIELQYHGELTIKDVEKICFQESDMKSIFSGLKPERRKSVIKTLKDNNIKMLYKQSSGKYTGDVYDWLKQTYPDDYPLDDKKV